MRFIALFCWRGVKVHQRVRAHSLNIQHHLSIHFNPKPSLPMLQQKVNNKVHESQHSLTLPRVAHGYC